MIDSTTSPVPAWKRYATMTVLTVLILVAGFGIYMKEIRHSSSAGAASPPAAAAAPAPHAQPKPTPTTLATIATSSRNPFGS